MHVAEHARKHRGTARPAQRVGDVAVFEKRAVAGDTIDIGGGRDFADVGSISRDRGLRMIIGHDEDDIWSRIIGRRRRCGKPLVFGRQGRTSCECQAGNDYQPFHLPVPSA